MLVDDAFQLTSVVTTETRLLFEAEFTSAKFFAARCVSNPEACMVELTRAFRTTDQRSVDLIGNIRIGRDIEYTLEMLNSICPITDAPADGAVWLSPRHIDADKVNLRRLGELEGPSRTYVGTVTGEFPENNLPVPRALSLKKDAQVVLGNNSAEWVNGTVAIVVALSSDGVEARLVSSGETVWVPAATWKQSAYSINIDSGLIDRTVVGAYAQVPMILTWGMTIHKSQGMTSTLFIWISAQERSPLDRPMSQCRDAAPCRAPPSPGPINRETFALTWKQLASATKCDVADAWNGAPVPRMSDHRFDRV